MRILGGEFKGRQILAGKDLSIRPTTNRIKNTIFNLLDNFCYDIDVLDMFCGTGSLGIEALSRGAREVTFIDKFESSLKILKNNITRLNIDPAKFTIMKEDEETCKALGRNGAALLQDGMKVLTHCNAGSLATSYWGTALGVLYGAQEQGKKIEVWVTETRPLLQGARLTCWELRQAGFDPILITDNSAGWVMQKEKIDCVLVGADRIALNGDVANKIGTYSLSVLAREHDIPMFVAAPLSTVDPAIETGAEIIIERRSPEEVLRFRDHLVAPDGTRSANFAFDVTPASAVTALITERGVFTPPYRKKLLQATRCDH